MVAVAVIMRTGHTDKDARNCTKCRNLGRKSSEPLQSKLVVYIDGLVQQRNMEQCTQLKTSLTLTSLCLEIMTYHNRLKFDIENWHYCHYHYVYLYTHSINWYSNGSGGSNSNYFLVNNCSISDHDNTTGMISYNSKSMVNQGRSTSMSCLSMDLIYQ